MFRCILEDASDAEHVNWKACKSILNPSLRVFTWHDYWDRNDVFCFTSAEIELPQSTYLCRTVRVEPSHQREFAVPCADVIARPLFDKRSVT